jgi:hypothetical protein
VPREWATLLKLRVPKQKTLPDALTVDEVHRLLDAVRTPHNRAFLWMSWQVFPSHHSKPSQLQNPTERATKIPEEP